MKLCHLLGMTPLVYSVASVAHMGYFLCLSLGRFSSPELDFMHPSSFVLEVREVEERVEGYHSLLQQSGFCEPRLKCRKCFTLLASIHVLSEGQSWA